MLAAVIIVIFLGVGNSCSDWQMQQSAPSAISPFARDNLPVFPGAVGFGTTTYAGRGGQIIKVTNLNASGPGSLKTALETAGPRIIVFEVGGTIDWTDLGPHVTIRKPFVTIAGQTAPVPGINIKGSGIRFATHDVLIQHIRIRVGIMNTQA
jgi:hypothetical protein